MTARPIAPEVRYAKHRLLPEIGPAGQARLCAARYAIDERDPAARYAGELLDRAGLERDTGGAPVVPEPVHAADPALAEVDAAIRGAIAATQRVREIVGLPQADHALGREQR
ncbi:MAG: hypothetical protein K1X94_12215 [Sandaracinaceae bacterium]|nr:hypothetical protein [Sandaracinaceae bacterium]